MVFLTGGTGFIGSYILYYLLRDGQKVKALKRSSSSLLQTQLIFKYLWQQEPIAGFSSPDEALRNVTWTDGDILDMDSLMEALAGCETVYHASALVSYERRKRNLIIRTNKEGTANVVNACLELGISKLAYVSSVAALPKDKLGGAVTEKFEAEENGFSNAYGESKYRAEMEVWRGMGEGLDVAVINPGIVLGWGDFKNSSLALFRTVHKGLKFYPTGTTGFVDARDVAKGLIKIAGTPEALNKRYIAVSENLPYKQLFDMMAAALNVKSPDVKVSSNLVKLVWLYAELKALLTGGTPFVTKDTAVASGKTTLYNNSRMKDKLGYLFIPIHKSVEDACGVLLAENTNRI